MMVHIPFKLLKFKLNFKPQLLKKFSFDKQYSDSRCLFKASFPFGHANLLMHHLRLAQTNSSKLPIFP